MSRPVQAPEAPVKRSRIAKALRVLSIPIILFWILVGVVTSVFVPSLEETTKENAGAMVPRDAPSTRGAVISGEAFQESSSTSVAVIILETHGRKLAAQDHQYYNEMVSRLRRDAKHVQSLQDMWGRPVTMSGQQSADAEAATVTVRPSGDLGEALSNESIAAIRKIVKETPNKPAGLDTYVTGPAPLSSDTLNAADESMFKLTIVTVVLITVLLLIVYRSLTTALMPLLAVLIELTAARGVIAFMVHNQYIGISSFAANMLVSLVLGAGTDYGIFLLGRYQEARRSGLDREDAYYVTVSSVSHVIIGSGLAISGATLCLSLTYLDYFRTLGPPCAVSMIVTVAAALTLGPAFLTLGSRLGLLDPKSSEASPIWRKLGTVIARWPVPLITAGAVIMLLCILGLGTYKVSYNDRDFEPTDTESSIGYAVADKHFPKSQLSVDNFYFQSDHDLRNTADLITLDRVAKYVFRVPGISMVQSVTRPSGRPVEHGSLPYVMGSMGTKIGQNIGFLRDRADDMGKMAASVSNVATATKQMQALTTQLANGTHLTRAATDRMKGITDTMRDDIAYIDDYMRPFRNYFYWETYCYELPWCWAGRSMFDAMDQIDKMADEMDNMSKGIAVIDVVTPQMVAQLGVMVESSATMQSLTLSVQSTLQTLIAQLDTMISPMIDMAQAFDNAKNDDFFFLPPDALKTADFKVGMDFFMTKDGKGVRFMIYHKGEAMSPAGVKQIEDATTAAQEALKGTALENNTKMYAAGAASNYRDIRDFAANDTTIMMLATFGLVFLIVLILTRAFAAACVVLATVIFSFAGAFGLSVLIWQDLLGIQLHWLTLPIAFIVLVAVGCDYNLLLLSRYKEEIGAGIKTGLIRAMGSSGSVVVTAAFVFAFTMLALLSSDVVNIGQAGSTICIGLILDMMVVRLLLVLPLARLFGQWFWWPLRIRPRPERTTG